MLLSLPMADELTSTVPSNPSHSMILWLWEEHGADVHQSRVVLVILGKSGQQELLGQGSEEGFGKT